MTKHQRRRQALIADWRGVANPVEGHLTAQLAGDLVGAIFKKCGLAERAKLEDVLAAWTEIVGAFLSEQTKPDSVQRGVLTVRLLQPAVHHALMMEKPRILQRIREQLSHVGIKDVRFKHG